MDDFENAKDKLLMGKERRTMVQSPEELKNTAYHESGHAIISKLLPETDPIHKVSIIPRGRALGVTMSLPEEDKYSSSRTELENRISILFGGRAAELVIFDRYTTGASDDIKKATKVARAMVCQLGMSEAVGPIAIGDQSQEVFIGREWVASRDHSEETARLVDAEVKRIVDTNMDKALQLLRENLPTLHAMAEALLERETITGEDVDLIMKGEPLPPMDAEQYRRKQERHSASRHDGTSGDGSSGSASSGSASSGESSVDASVSGQSSPDEGKGDGASEKSASYTAPLVYKPKTTSRSPLGTAVAGQDAVTDAQQTTEENKSNDEAGKGEQ